MRVLISTLALIICMGWSVAYFRFDTGGPFHLTLVVALIALITQWLPSSKP